MAIFVTIFSGVLVYVIGQIIVKLIIDPVNDLKKAMSGIVYDMVFYGNLLSQPSHSRGEMDEVCKVMRQHSSLLHAATHLIPGYQYIYRLFVLPSPENIKKVTGKLIFLSNGYAPSNLSFDEQLKSNINKGNLNKIAMQEIKSNLGIPIQN